MTSHATSYAIALLILLSLINHCTGYNMHRSKLFVVNSKFSRTTSLGRKYSTQKIDPVLEVSNHKFSVAPMMEYTDSHMRYFSRLLSKRLVLYTEMEATSTLLNCKDLERRFDQDIEAVEPVVLQVGGFRVHEMQLVAKLAASKGYKLLNINSGCPSPVVAGDGCFGAALMRKPRLVADMCNAIYDGMGVVPSVKCRLGLDEWNNRYDLLADYISTIHTFGKCNHFVIHARHAILTKKLSAAQNREIPPLMYDYAYSLVKDFPDISFTINGGIKSLDECKEHLSKGVVGVMVGRSFVENPLNWSHVDTEIYKDQLDPSLPTTRRQLLQAYSEYCVRIEKKFGPRSRAPLLRPIADLFNGIKGTKAYKNMLSKLIQQNRLNDNIVCTDSIIMNSIEECFEDEILDANFRIDHQNN